MLSGKCDYLVALHCFKDIIGMRLDGSHWSPGQCRGAVVDVRVATRSQ